LDCLIVGGGPAGAALAGLLAKRGWSVALVHDDRNRHATPVETLLPASLPALERCGLAAVVRAACEPDTRRHGACWEDAEWVWQPRERPGFVVQRARLDAALRAFATTHGAALWRGTVVALAGSALAHEVVVLASGQHHTLRARTVALATGRRPLRHLLPTTIVATGPETAAFALQGDALPDARQLATVEAARAGWSWWIGHGGGGSGVVVADLADVRKRGRARGPAATLRTATLVGAVRATARALATEQPVLLLGDAASTLDPLASQGTEKALVSAEAAMVALDTALRHPDWHALALQHHARWELDLWRAHQRAAEDFYARVTRFADEPFWAARRGGSAASPQPMPDRLVLRADVQAAVALRRVGDQLEPETGWALPHTPPIARLGRVLLLPIGSAFQTPTAVTDGIAQAGQHPALFSLGSAAVRAAVHELWQRGYLQQA
jgi:2-polyprenyl-6-methoxyphenol hydroxylase-like FAD-dependent oxidoreductase